MRILLLLCSRLAGKLPCPESSVSSTPGVSPCLRVDSPYRVPVMQGEKMPQRSMKYWRCQLLSLLFKSKKGIKMWAVVDDSL